MVLSFLGRLGITFSRVSIGTHVVYRGFNIGRAATLWTELCATADDMLKHDQVNSIVRWRMYCDNGKPSTTYYDAVMVAKFRHDLNIPCGWESV